MVVKKYQGDGWTIEIDEEKCVGSGECVKVCPANVFELIEGKSTAPRTMDCVQCCVCVDSCPVKAIKHSSC